MTPELKQQWVTALRSGHYPQTKGHLKLIADLHGCVAGYCCLGVLCEIANIPQSKGHDQCRVYFADASTLPSDDILQNLGLSSIQCKTLAGKNDAGKSFAEIADYIEGRIK